MQPPKRESQFWACFPHRSDTPIFVFTASVREHSDGCENRRKSQTLDQTRCPHRDAKYNSTKQALRCVFGNVSQGMKHANTSFIGMSVFHCFKGIPSAQRKASLVESRLAYRCLADDVVPRFWPF